LVILYLSESRLPQDSLPRPTGFRYIRQGCLTTVTCHSLSHSGQSATDEESVNIIRTLSQKLLATFQKTPEQQSSSTHDKSAGVAPHAQLTDC
jgi:hypothetical protein